MATAPRPLPVQVSPARNLEPTSGLAEAQKVAEERRVADDDARERAFRLKCLDYATAKAPEGASVDDIVAAAEKYLTFLAGPKP